VIQDHHSAHIARCRDRPPVSSSFNVDFHGIFYDCRDNAREHRQLTGGPQQQSHRLRAVRSSDRRTIRPLTFAELIMAGSAENKLRELGISLPKPPAPIANYVPFVRTGNLLTVSGQVCFDGDGKLVAKGQLGGAVSVEDGQKAARACAINLLAQVKVALGDLDKVVRVVRLGGFINSAVGFGDGPKVMNAASDLMVAVFGDKGKHARSTVGVAALPADAAVEVEAAFEVS
jgi:enamine deaminase RidA (YjgF/YER057c/UK114 family)